MGSLHADPAQANGAASAPPKRLWIFDNPRCRSHVFFRMFCKHPALGQIYHPFLPTAFLGPQRIQHHFKHSQAAADWWDTCEPLMTKDTHDSCRRQLEDAVQEVERQGKTVLGCEHAAFALDQGLALNLTRDRQMPDPASLSSNITHFPGPLLDSLTPIVLVRHPALLVPSVYRMNLTISELRPGDDDFAYMCSLLYARVLADWMRDVEGREVLVVDGEDACWRTRQVIERLCARIGIDPDGVVETWEPTRPEERPSNPIVWGFTGTMHESTGMVRPEGEQPKISLDVEFENWRKEWGDEVAGQLRGLAEENMPHYEYLKKFEV